MGFKRAEWHSGLTYQQTCENCKTVLQYTDYSLDFRPWYADGFVYCPKCKTPLRHNENYAINAQPAQPAPAPVPAPAPAPAPASAPAPAEEKPAYMVTPAEQAGTAPVPVAEPAPAPVAEPAPAPVLPAFCTNCGNKYGPNDRFCPMCGKKRG